MSGKTPVGLIAPFWQKVLLEQNTFFPYTPKRNVRRNLHRSHFPILPPCLFAPMSIPVLYPVSGIDARPVKETSVKLRLGSPPHDFLKWLPLSGQASLNRKKEGCKHAEHSRLHKLGISISSFGRPDMDSWNFIKSVMAIGPAAQRRIVHSTAFVWSSFQLCDLDFSFKVSEANLAADKGEPVGFPTCSRGSCGLFFLCFLQMHCVINTP